MFLDREVDTQRLKEEPAQNPDLVSPGSPVSTRDPIPLPLEDDPVGGLQQHLRQLAKDLPITRRRPTAWRWVVVSVWTALVHALAANRPASFQLGIDPGELPGLFRVVAIEHPELPQVE